MQPPTFTYKSPAVLTRTIKYKIERFPISTNPDSNDANLIYTTLMITLE
jgi:hypothetical protein